MPDLSTIVQQISIIALPLLLAITLHEVAHGWMALKLGDTTAKGLGRLTLNPIKHIDPVGTIAVPLAVWFLSGFSFVFGWAKPVPVSTRAFKNPRRSMAIVALAGPAANLCMAFAWLAVALFSVHVLDGMPWVARPLELMGGYGVQINLVLAALNLLPLPPLDGGRVLAGAVPMSVAQTLDRVEPYGLLILIALFYLGVIGHVLPPLMAALYWIVRLPFLLIGA